MASITRVDTYKSRCSVVIGVMVMWRPMNLQCVLLDKMGTPTLVLTKPEEHSLNRHADSPLFYVEVA